jgi:hypothetical protein
VVSIGHLLTCIVPCVAVLAEYLDTQQQIAMATSLEGGVAVFPSTKNTGLDGHLVAGLVSTFRQHTSYLTALVEKVSLTFLFLKSLTFLFFPRCGTEITGRCYCDAGSFPSPKLLQTRGQA